MGQINNKQILNYIIAAGIVVLIGIACYHTGYDNGLKDSIKDVKVDTSYNKVKLDSIKIHIDKRDTTIYTLNVKMKDDVEKVLQLDDTATLNKFYELLSDK